MKRNILTLLLLGCLACLFGPGLALAAEAAAIATPAMPAASLLDILAANKAVLLAALLAVSEVLALMPSIKANSIFQLLLNGLKAMAGNQVKPSGR